MINDYNVGGAMLNYVPMLHTKANQHFRCEDRSASDLG